MAVQPTTLPSDRGDKRERIEQAALELFAERGFHGTAVPLIAERAGVGAGTIYRYFPSKEALVNALYQRLKLGLLADVVRDFPSTLSLRDQFHHLFSRVVAWAQANPAAFQFLELHHHAPYLDAQSLAIEERVLSLALGYLAESSQQKVTKPYAPMVLVAAVWGTMVRLLRCGFEGTLVLGPEVLADAERLCWEAIRL